MLGVSSLICVMRRCSCRELELTWKFFLDLSEVKALRGEPPDRWLHTCRRPARSRFSRVVPAQVYQSRRVSEEDPCRIAADRDGEADGMRKRTDWEEERQRYIRTRLSWEYHQLHVLDSSVEFFQNKTESRPGTQDQAEEIFSILLSSHNRNYDTKR